MEILGIDLSKIGTTAKGEVPIELLPCPDCGADPSEHCVIHSAKGREPHDKNHVQAVCNKCGFSVMVRSSAKASAIRRFWNAGRDNDQDQRRPSCQQD